MSQVSADDLINMGYFLRELPRTLESRNIEQNSWYAQCGNLSGTITRRDDEEGNTNYDLWIEQE